MTIKLHLFILAGLKWTSLITYKPTKDCPQSPCLYRIGYTPLAVLKIKDSGTAPGHWFFPEAREFSRPISAKSVFRQPAFPWNYPIGSRYHMTLFLGVAAAEPVPVHACDCHSKISLSCASKSSLTASYFHLIVLNLLSPHVQQTKVAFPAPKYCDTSPSERQKQIVSRNAAADSTILCKFRLVLAPKLCSDTSTEHIMALSIIVT